MWFAAALLMVASYSAIFIYWRDQALQVESAPLEVVGAEVSPDKALDISAIATLFGSAEKEEKQESVKESSLSLKLVASYVVPEKKRSAAIISSGEDNQKLFYVGDKIQAGVELKAVQAGRILIKRNGVLESISLEDGSAGGVVPVESQAAAPVEVAAATPVAKPGNNQEMLEKLKKLKSIASGEN
ncbi:hypothetical protein LRS11_16010 [Pseudomonas sp. J452]|uniref:type II secretion system protein N n=1 Tax=Pseudomonas sp. J452 TaxID=2898441 RepID=UPI0021AD5302|nr:type II secretion system protein N [Pseudomonas sp. J452]UUY07318.1 hypothetical protein LRS11_16010 [Pseudomonas sp. J452]